MGGRTETAAPWEPDDQWSGGACNPGQFGLYSVNRNPSRVNTLPEKRMARTVERPNRYFTFLRRLRAEGRSNMYGAVPYLASAFGIDRNESFRIICEWIDAQEALIADSTAPKAIVPKAVVPAERAAAPTLFDPVPPAAQTQRSAGRKAASREAASRGAAAPSTASPSRSQGNPASRKPVKQRARAEPGATSARVAPKKPAPSAKRAAPKKASPSSDSRAA